MKDVWPPGAPSPKKRGDHLAKLKAWKMALDAHGFVRASAALFYAALEEGLDEQIPAGPPLWISGDCHGENIGAVADAHGSAHIDLNDFDECVVGYAAHDVLRLALDMVVAARSYEELRGIESVSIVHAVLEGYRDALQQRTADKTPALEEAPPQLRKLLRRTAREQRSDLLDHRVPLDKEGKRRFVHGARYYALGGDERAAVENLFENEDVRRLVASLSDDASDDSIEVVDAAFRVAGTGSLGCFRAAVLVRVGKGKKKKDDDSLRLVDVKEALPSRAIRHDEGKTPADDAERVVLGARALVPSFGDRMLAATVLDRRVVVRELMPQERKVKLAVLKKGEAAPIARHLGAVVGRAHARQLVPEAATELRELLAPEKSGRPPAWLWEPLIALVARHEAAYLRHCGELAADHPELAE